jgi:hypothetical protein
MSSGDPNDTVSIKLFRETIESIGLPAARVPATDPAAIADTAATTIATTFATLPSPVVPIAVATVLAPLPTERLACLLARMAIFLITSCRATALKITKKELLLV